MISSVTEFYSYTNNLLALQIKELKMHSKSAENLATPDPRRTVGHSLRLAYFLWLLFFFRSNLIACWRRLRTWVPLHYFGLIFVDVDSGTDKVIVILHGQSFRDGHVLHPVTLNLLFFCGVCLCFHDLCYFWLSSDGFLLYEYSFILFPKDGRHLIDGFFLERHPGNSVWIFGICWLIDNGP